MPQNVDTKNGGFPDDTEGKPPIYFFTLVTKDVRGFPQYLASCARFGIEPVILGRGQKWAGHTMKLRLLAEVLPTLDPHEIVVMSDSYDLVFQKGPAQLYECYTQYSKPVVFSSETGSGWPNPAKILPETPDSRYRSLNGGFWMATVKAARKMIDEAYPDGFKDEVVDQWALQQWLSKHPDEGVVDWKNTLVTSPASTDVKNDLDCSGVLIRYKPTDTYPCAIHVAGFDMTFVFRVLELPGVDHMIPGGRSQQLFIMNRFALDYPWPLRVPGVSEDNDGMFEQGNAKMLTRILQENKVRVILELGSWVGMGSTKFFMGSKNFNGMIICNDTWRDDSPELATSEWHKQKIPILYETFCRNNWKHRNRIVTLRQDTLIGLKTVSTYGIHPDLIYVDANHEYDSVMAQLKLIRELFPESIVTGDDWKAWDSVKQAVSDFAGKHDLEIDAYENFWRLKST